MNRPLRIGISTCPNDTFAFHAILEKKIDLQDLEFEIELMDIEELNSGIFAGRFDVAKASFSAAIDLSRHWLVLPSGSALGFGVGPLLLASAENSCPENSEQLTLCPGAHTTATLLFKLFYGNTSLQHDVFSNIMPRLKDREADFGVCIHEGRFTYQESGLFLVEDLGTRWESETGSPLPLGGILAKRELPVALLARIQLAIRQSIHYGLENRNETLPTMRRYAQEFDDEILMRHVDLYVNEWTIELGDTGRDALLKLSEYAGNAGLGSSEDYPIRVFASAS